MKNRTRSSNLFLVIVLFCSIHATGQTFRFTDFNYPDESITWGSQSRISYFIPVDKERLMEGNKLVLNFETSEVLDKENSFVTLIIGDIPVSTKNPSENNNIDISVPLAQKNIKNGYLKIEVVSDLSINDDYCQLYSQGALWIKRTSSSYILLNYEEPKATFSKISDYIKRTEKLLLPREPSLLEIQYASYIKFYHKAFMEIDLDIDHIPDTLTTGTENSLILGKVENLPGMYVPKDISSVGPDNGWVGLRRFRQRSKDIDTAEYHHALIITGKNDTGFEKAAQSLLDEDILKSAFTSYYEVYEGKDLSKYENATIKKTTLRELGVEEELTDGIGRLSKEIKVNGPIFGTGISSLEFNLALNYRPVKETEDVYLNIYVDDVLKYSQELDETGSFNNSIKLEGIQLNKFNTIKVEYYYVPEGGFCKEDPAAFYAQIDLDRSSLSVSSYYKNDKRNFFYFNENFRETTPKIYWDLAFHKENVETLNQLIDLINPIKSKGKIIYPEMMRMDKLKNYIDKHNSMIITSEERSLNEFAENREFLRLQDEKYDLRIQDYKDYFKMDYADRIGVNQLFEKASLSHMYTYVPEKDPEVFDQLIGAIVGQKINNTGDLILADKDEAYFFDLRDTLNNLPDSEINSSFDKFWLKYRIFIIFGAAVLFLVLLIYIFQKSQESKKNIVDDK